MDSKKRSAESVPLSEQKKIKHVAEEEEEEEMEESSEEEDEDEKGEEEEVEEEEEEEEDTFNPDQLIEEERLKLISLIPVLSEVELTRFETARRCSLNPKDVEKTMGLILGKNAKGAAEKALTAVGGEVPPIDEKVIIAMSGLVKMYLQEIIERARIIAGERDERGKIHPRHLREAYRRMKIENALPGSLALF